MALKQSLSEVQAALQKHAGHTASVLLEQTFEKKVKSRISGLIVSDQFRGVDSVRKWALVGEWLDTEEIDQAVVGLLTLWSPEEYALHKKKK